MKRMMLVLAVIAVVLSGCKKGEEWLPDPKIDVTAIPVK